jgi:hypothetical protein
MVDAQLPGVATRVRHLAGVAASGQGWQERLLEEYALLHLLARAGVCALGGPVPQPGPDRAGVLAHLGVAVPAADVLARPPVRDRWAVLAQQDSSQDRLTVRRTWLWGDESRRPALVLSFAAAGGALDATLVPGTTLEADLHHHPGQPPLRAVVGARHAPPEHGLGRLAGVGVVAALEAWSQALALDPWLSAWPVVLDAVVPVHHADSWWLVDPQGEAALAVHGVAEAAWVLLAVSGGRPTRLLAEVSSRGARPIAVLPAAADGAAGQPVAL